MQVPQELVNRAWQIFNARVQFMTQSPNEEERFHGMALNSDEGWNQYRIGFYDVHFGVPNRQHMGTFYEFGFNDALATQPRAANGPPAARAADGPPAARAADGPPAAQAEEDVGHGRFYGARRYRPHPRNE